MALDIPYMQDVNAVRRAQPKSAIPTKLDEKVAKDNSTDRAWGACVKAVDKRDGQICRVCGCHVVASLELLPNRAEHAHIIRRRKEKALLNDPRNVFKSCHRCHTKFDAHKLRIVQKASDRFVYDGKKYVNANKPLRFEEAK